MATLTFSAAAQGYDLAQGASLTVRSASNFSAEDAVARIAVTGTGFTYDASTGMPTGGTMTGFKVYLFNNGGTSTPIEIGSGTGLNQVLSTYSFYYSGLQSLISQLLSGADIINGSGGNDYLKGEYGNDSIIGNNGNDTLVGGYGSYDNDTLVGGAGDDLYVLYNGSSPTIIEAASAGTDKIQVQQGYSYGLAANVENAEVLDYYNGTNTTINGNALHNLITGSNGNDSLAGAAGNDHLYGKDGNDTLDGGIGSDTMLGGLGSDTYYVNVATDRIYEVDNSYGNESADWVISDVSYTLGNYLENLRLKLGTTALNGTGNALNNILVANNGNNILNGGLGSDTVSFETANTKVTSTLTAATGGSGTDTLVAIENLRGGIAGDDLTGNSANNVLDGNTGNDTMKGGDGNDTYYVDAIGDVVSESSLAGGGSADMVYSRVDFTLGNYVEDLSFLPNTSYIFYDYAASSSAVNGTGNALANKITGNWNGNKLLGMAGNDTIDGYDGNDTIDGGAGADSMSGGYGSDAYYVDHLGDVVAGETYQYNYDYETGVQVPVIDSVFSKVSFALPANVENLTLQGAGNINGGGNNAENLIITNSGSNYLDGGMGIDTLSYGSHTVAVNVSLASTGSQVTGGSGSDTIINFENLTGGSGNDKLTGSSLANVLDGGLGNDTLTGGAGDDTYIVNAPTDSIVEGLSAGNDTVHASGLAGNTFTLAANVENILFDASASNAMHANGNTLANLMVGNQGANNLIGGDGNDTLDGGAGTDALNGGLGNDVYYVDATTDVVTEAASAGTDMVIVGYSFAYDSSAYVLEVAPFTLRNNVENLHLDSSNYNSLTGTGNSLNNRITADKGNDQLNGAAGNDTLSGGLGYDILTGGTGNDVFLFDSALGTGYYSDGYDTLIDFTSGADKIHLSDDVFTALNAPGALNASSLLVGTGSTATAPLQRVIYNTSTGALFYDADGSGYQHSAIQIALVGTAAHSALTVADFLVV